MSGGAYNYGYFHLQELAEAIKEEAEYTTVWSAQTKKNERILRPIEEIKARMTFALLLSEAAEAARLLEWYDSGDSGDWETVNRAVMGVLKGKDV